MPLIKDDNQLRVGALSAGVGQCVAAMHCCAAVELRDIAIPRSSHSILYSGPDIVNRDSFTPITSRFLSALRLFSRLRDS